MAELVSNLVENAKSVGIVLTSASAVSYASGYLALRSRAHALGTDPGFTLLDQAYVFAGFRFAVITLVALLVISPLLILVKIIAATLARVTMPKHLEIFAWLGAVAVAILTLAGFSTLFIEGALLEDGPAHYTGLKGFFVTGVLGSNNAGVVVVLIATATTAVTLLWLRGRFGQTRSGDSLTLVLVVIAALQLVLLPMQYGIFFADRTARVLERPPDGLVDIAPTAWLLDRGPDRATLLARHPDRHFVLITVKTEKLDGLAVTGTRSIAEIVSGGDAP
jgi:hypothetical protein